MSKELHFPAGGRDGRDAELGDLLRPLYEAPAEPEYWDGLHARILRGVATRAERAVEAPVEWWMVLSRWSRLGAAAAALIAAAAGALWLQHHATEARMAYEAGLAEPPIYSMELAPDDLGPPAPRAP